MWRRRNTAGRWCAAAATWLVVGVVACLPAAVTLGQAGQDAPRVDESHGRTVHRLVERWVGRGGVPGERAAAVRVSGVMGVRITLRLDGVTVGQGTRVRSDLEQRLTADGPGLPWASLLPIDLIDLIEPATEEALADALDHVKRQNLQARIRAAGDPENQNDRSEITLQELGPQLHVDVQIAYGPEQVVIAVNASDDRIYAMFAPGFHGLFGLPGTVSAGETPVWPATSLARNASPRRQIVRLLTRCGLEPDDIEQLGRPDGVAVGRFEVLHLVRPNRDLPVMRLVRGGQLLPARFVDEATLSDMADRVALHLYGRFIGINGEVRGSYLPARAIYRPELANDLEAALASYVLIRHVERKRLDGVQDQFYLAMVEAAQRTVNRVVGRLLAPDASPDAVTAAFSLLTLIEAPAGTFDPGMDERVAAILLAMVGPEGRMQTDPDDPQTRVSPAGAAAALAALGAWYEQTRDAEVGRALASGLESLWTQTGGRFDVNTLPWIALVHVQASGLLEDAGLLDAETRATRGGDLSAMNELIERFQIVERPKLGPPDVEGGVILTPAPEGSPPNPNWQTAPLFGFMATTLRDPQVVPDRQRPGTLVTASAAARFLGQLMIDEPNCFGIRSPQEAVGGIRLSLWDNTLDLAPSAITLMALLEMRESLDALGGEER